VLRRVPAIPAGCRPPAAIAPRRASGLDRGSGGLGAASVEGAWAIREAGGGGTGRPLSLAARGLFSARLFLSAPASAASPGTSTARKVHH
jgi:hypothetical protein